MSFTYSNICRSINLLVSISVKCICSKDELFEQLNCCGNILLQIVQKCSKYVLCCFCFCFVGRRKPDFIVKFLHVANWDCGTKGLGDWVLLLFSGDAVIFDLRSLRYARNELCKTPHYKQQPQQHFPFWKRDQTIWRRAGNAIGHGKTPISVRSSS